LCLQSRDGIVEHLLAFSVIEAPHPKVFFFQAEAGLRGLIVTGVQTCALPISSSVGPVSIFAGCSSAVIRLRRRTSKIGRASCRERVEISVVAVSLKKKR